MSKPKILIGLCTMGSVHTFLLVRILAWISQAIQKGEYNISIYPTINVAPVDQARNEVVEEFMKSDCTHLLFIDSDTIPPQEAIERLLRVNQDIVSAVTPIIEHDPARQNSDSNGFYRKMNAVSSETGTFVKENTGVVPIKGCGSSCVLIKRKVFEALPKPWYRFIYNDDNGKDTVVGEDIHFVAKAVGKGFKAYADTNVVCHHNKEILW